MPKTVNDLYLEFRKTLKEAGVSGATLEAKEICAYACDQDKHQIAGWAYVYLTQETEDKARALLQRRLDQEPLAYLIHEWDFYGLTFEITPDVLIPRSDTEPLCELAIQKANQIVNPRVLDLCCGSGCIGIAIAKHAHPVRVVAVDISTGALTVARRNAFHHKLSESCYVAAQGDARKPYDGRLGEFHILVCNPPYITQNEMRELDLSVRDYEPELALYGGIDGLDFYRSICENWKSALLTGGEIMFECGWRQGEQVAAILEENGYGEIALHADLSGVQRIVTGKKM